MWRFCFVLSFVLFPATGCAQAPKKALPGDDIIETYLREETRRLSERVLDGAKTLPEWEKRRPRLRQEYFSMLGLWPLPEKTPLKAAITGTLERDGVVIEMLHFQSMPGLYVTGNLYRPKGAVGKLPTILYVCGHSGRGRDGNKTAFQDHGMWFARNGYVCLIIDTLQLGEVAGKHHGTYNLGRWWWQSAGYTSAGVECWNGVRAIDYLVSRKDVDASKIGVTGISGGGAATIWIAAADERVRCAVPVSGMSDLESYVSNKVINGHCDCMLLINTYQWEWTTIAALIAPRPMLFANSDNDRIFPMDGNRRIIKRLRAAYKLYGKADLVDEYVSKGGHDYRPDLRVAVFKFINLHVKGERGPVKDADDKPLPGKQLRVFPEDRDIPANALNHKIDETFVPRGRPKLPDAKGFAEWKKGQIARLRELSFRPLPDRVTEKDKPLIEPARVRKAEPEAGDGLLVVLNEDETSAEWATKLAGKGEVRVLTVRGTGALRWTKKSPPNYVERAHALLGQTVEQGRVWEVAVAVNYLTREDKGRRAWKVAGMGRAGVVAAYAALFEPSIKEVIVVDPTTSHVDGPHFLNVLRIQDVPDALGMLAPKRLTLIGAKDKAFERTVEIYKRAGAAEKVTRK